MAFLDVINDVTTHIICVSHCGLKPQLNRYRETISKVKGKSALASDAGFADGGKDAAWLPRSNKPRQCLLTVNSKSHRLLNGQDVHENNETCSSDF